MSRIRDALEAAGRDRYSARIYTLLTIITDETDEKAQAKYEDYLRYASHEGALVFMSGWMGIDLSQYDLDEPVGNVKSNAIQSAVANYAGVGEERRGVDGARHRRRRRHRRPRPHASSGRAKRSPTSCRSGSTTPTSTASTSPTPSRRAPSRTSSSTSCPVLRARGAYPSEYVEGTLRHKLHGGGDRLPAEHKGSRYRIGGDLSTAVATTSERAALAV